MACDFRASSGLICPLTRENVSITFTNGGICPNLKSSTRVNVKNWTQLLMVITWLEFPMSSSQTREKKRVTISADNTLVSPQSLYIKRIKSNSVIYSSANNVFTKLKLEQDKEVYRSPFKVLLLIIQEKINFNNLNFFSCNLDYKSWCCHFFFVYSQLRNISNFSPTTNLEFDI